MNCGEGKHDQVTKRRALAFDGGFCPGRRRTAVVVFFGHTRFDHLLFSPWPQSLPPSLAIMSPVMLHGNHGTSVDKFHCHKGNDTSDLRHND